MEYSDIIVFDVHVNGVQYFDTTQSFVMITTNQTVYMATTVLCIIILLAVFQVIHSFFIMASMLRSFVCVYVCSMSCFGFYHR